MVIYGTYNVEIQAPVGRVTGILTLKSKGTALNGTYEAEGGTRPLTGTTSGNDITLFTEVGNPPKAIKLELKGTVLGNEITGGARANGSEPSPFKAVRA